MIALAAPPTNVSFPSREALLTHVRDFGAVHGYVVVIQKSNVPRGQLWLRCDLGASSRRRRSQHSDCPFQMYARRTSSGKWTLKVQNATHNHEAEPLVLHPVACRLLPEHKRLVRELTDDGLRPARILEILKERFPGKPFKVQEIYNARNSIRRERLAGHMVFAEDENHEAGETTAVPVLPSVAMQTVESGNDLKSILHEVWERMSDRFAKWRPEVQRDFAQELEHLMETCSKQNDSLSRGTETRTAIYSESVAAELGDFTEGQEAVADAFLRGNLTVNANDIEFEEPMALPSPPIELAQVSLSTLTRATEKCDRRGG